MSFDDSTIQAHYMRRAIEEVHHHIDHRHGGPFGACIVKDNQILALQHNTVLKQCDPTCHAEINAIRQATATLQSIHLSGCQIYSTTEPCPMCFAAIHWAKIDTVIFGTRIEDVHQLGFNELTISNQQLKEQGNSPIDIIKDFMRHECIELLSHWSSQVDHQIY